MLRNGIVRGNVVVTRCTLTKRFELSAVGHLLKVNYHATTRAWFVRVEHHLTGT